ncbi:SRPBCC domain-containing protein [Nocardiopsis mangrovi]|uniref:SRPBCC domain-containing protein n=1 Tax=Nocardiopsis mangrovi TaxID=1179818 RepID=A0ABV9E6W7_9ACTN
MGREFELRKDVELDATPEQVWAAIATGPGIESWFMGPYEIEPREGGAMRMTVHGDVDESTITAWEPPTRLCVRGTEAEDGTFHAFEYIVEGREGGSTVLRFVHSGFIGGDWGDEYVAQTGHGWDMYLHTLGEYLAHFTGRAGTFVYAEGPRTADGSRAWPRVAEALGVPESVPRGERVLLAPEGLPPIKGIADYTVPGHPDFLGVRTDSALYRFHGHGDTVVVGHHLFADGVDRAAEDDAWKGWLARVLG